MLFMVFPLTRYPGRLRMLATTTSALSCPQHLLERLLVVWPKMRLAGGNPKDCFLACKHSVGYHNPGNLNISTALGSISGTSWQSQGVLNYLNTSMKHNGKQFKNMNINTVCNTTGVNNIVYVSRKKLKE